MLKRRIKVLLKVLLTLFALIFVFMLFERLRGQISLAGYRRELAAIGEKLTARDFQSSYSETDNGAPAVAEWIERFKDGPVLPKHYPPRMKLTVSGRAIIGYRESDWVEDKVTNHWDQLASDLKTNEATLAEIRSALAKPVLNNHLDLAQGMKLQFPHLWRGKTLTYWFASGAQLALHEDRLHDASRELVSEISLPRLMAEDHTAISELVRIAIAAVAKTDTWEALQADGWTDEDLVPLQKAWESHDFAGSMARSLEGERIFSDATSELLRASNDDTFNLLFSGDSKLAALFLGAGFEDSSWEKFLESLPYGEQIADFARKQIYCRVWRFSWSHQEQLRSTKNLQALLELGRICAKNKSYKAIENALDQLSSNTEAKNFYEQLRYPGPDSVRTLSRTILKAMQTETDRSLTVCAVVLKRYSLRHGKLPTTLDVLVPEFISSVPVDYMDGKPVKYRFKPDGTFTLYSVGEDGRDDGGDLALMDGRKNTRSLWARKDFVWPSPALPEEIETYRKEAAKN
ncbi:MAG: hypothetical protein HY298_16990 [Verrucomicrobia bacterium]|nr:hypothetical protein [Verrucomicrobiota bacterium]